MRHGRDAPSVASVLDTYRYGAFGGLVVDVFPFEISYNERKVSRLSRRHYDLP